ncbi:hypothetical protein DWU98_16650 [Dyella monticola]|uniref:Uncharacterized protein n=1 Tax=Dyella monticola TaxID=1927958 RepID=A0A370WU64_9GAMM|nr:hypothetical protein DWU98_16650 [Dyella monticola]
MRDRIDAGHACMPLLALTRESDAGARTRNLRTRTGVDTMDIAHDGLFFPCACAVTTLREACPACVGIEADVRAA